MDDPTRQNLRQQVQAHYSDVARSADQPCSCGCAAPAAIPDFIPLAAVNSARGCGNPLALAELQPGETVLDLGSGGGLEVLLAAQRVGAGGWVYGLDGNPDMIALAERNAAQAGIENVRFLHGELEAIPLPDRSVDVILSNCVINLTPDKTRALTEAFRVLRPGGRLAVSDIVIDPNLDDLALPQDEIRRRLSWASCFAGALTSGQLRQALVQAGFEAIQLRVESRGSIDELVLAPGQSWEPLAMEQAQAVASRFASLAISARRPQ